MRNHIYPYLKKAPKMAFDLVKGESHFEWDSKPCSCYNMPMQKRINLVKSGINLLAKNPKVDYMPIETYFELTSYCNLRCPLCPTGSKAWSRKPQNLDVSLFEKIMNEISQYLMAACYWGWGESLLHPQFEDILRLSYNRGFNVILSTNGQNLNNDSVINAILKYPPTYLIVSLDGITDETLSVYRVGAKLQPALEGVKEIARFRTLKPNIVLQYMVMEHNKHELPELKGFAKQNYFDTLTVRALADIMGDNDKWYKLVSKEHKKGYDNRQNNNYTCPFALTVPIVYADGILGVCCQDCREPLMNYGNLNTSSFKDVWQSNKATMLRKAILTHPEKIPNCITCSRRNETESEESLETCKY